MGSDSARAFRRKKLTLVVPEVRVAAERKESGCCRGRRHRILHFSNWSAGSMVSTERELNAVSASEWKWERKSARRRERIKYLG